MAERPEKFEGEIVIEFPAGAHIFRPLKGHQVAVHSLGGALIPTVTSMAVHVSPDDVVWAELTMLADENGAPALTGQTAWSQEGEPAKGTFAFQVSGIVTAPPAEPRPRSLFDEVFACTDAEGGVVHAPSGVRGRAFDDLVPKLVSAGIVGQDESGGYAGMRPMRTWYGEVPGVRT